MSDPTPIPRVIATASAVRLIAALAAEHGPLLFHQSGGCCDGSFPMCFAQGDFLVGDQDVLLGEIAGAGLDHNSGRPGGGWRPAVGRPSGRPGAPQSA